jgi:hypothetical protein
MTHAKHEIAVFIENEEMLREAMELLEKYGEEIDKNIGMFQLHDKELNYLKRAKTGWYLGGLYYTRTQITLPQLEEILKNQ